MRILFILPKFNKDQGPFYNPCGEEPDYNYLMPVGMPYIVSYLKQAGYIVNGLNLNHKYGTIKEIIQTEIIKTRYDIAFTGGLSGMFPEIRDIVSHIREVSPETKIVIGGGLVSAQPEPIMKLINPDFGVIYEGEETALELVRWIESKPNCLDNPEIKGIVYTSKADGRVHINPTRGPIKNLDALPYPDLDIFEYEKYISRQFTGGWNLYSTSDYPRPYSIVSARGCTAACSFCYHTTGPSYRYRSVENIMAEIKYAVEKYHINFFTFLDELFSYDKPRLLKFCALFQEYQKTIPWRVEMYCNLRVDCVDGEILDALKSCKNVVIGLGLESMSPVVLKSMRKHITPEQTKQCLKLIAERKLVPQGVYIFGDPAETLETANETLSFIQNHPELTRGGVFVGFVIPFPGTGIYKDALKSGLIPDETRSIECITDLYEATTNFTKLSNKDFEKLKAMVNGLRIKSRIESVPKIISPYTMNGKKYIEVFVICPHCKSLIHYCNTGNPDIQPVPVVCKNPNCNGRFDIVNRRTKFEQFIVKTLGFALPKSSQSIMLFIKRKLGAS